MSQSNAPLSQLHNRSQWIYVWGIDPLGECCCPLRGECPSPGKHPWSGFPTGAAHAASRSDVIEQFGPVGSRQWAITLSDLLVVDIDNERSMHNFSLIHDTIPRDKVLAVAKTLRGWHIYLDIPGWTQKAVNRQMSDWWEGNWHGTDQRKVRIDGCLLDVRTGPRRYVVVPHDHDVDARVRPGARRWALAGEFGRAISWARRVGSTRGGSALLSARVPAVDTDTLVGPPWAVPMTDALAEHIASFGQDGHIEVPTSGANQAETVWSDLEHWCRVLSRKGPDSGRNNLLNAIAYYTGSVAVQVGYARSLVESVLLSAARECGCEGAEATVRSGLDSGLRQIAVQA